MTYSFRLGTYGSNQQLTYNNTPVSVGGKPVYLCPWELKHVDTITMSCQGTTATVGIPNKPATRTQIFDTSGIVRTFKITGKRYDWEERISNYDFVNTQFNFAKDPIIGGNKEYCYIGMNWMFSTMQVLLKGYLFTISNDDTSDNRFIYTNMNNTTAGQGFNVGITQFNADFSDTEPGLLNYNITLTERFKVGDSPYKPYLTS